MYYTTEEYQKNIAELSMELYMQKREIDILQTKVQEAYDKIQELTSNHLVYLLNANHNDSYTIVGIYDNEEEAFKNYDKCKEDNEDDNTSFTLYEFNINTQVTRELNYKLTK